MRIFFNPSYLWESLLVYDHMWESIFWTLYENKLVYESHHFKKKIFYHQNTVMIFCWYHMFQVCVLLFWILFILCLVILLLNKVFLNSLNSVVIFTPFAVLDSLPSSESIEYIFDFNLANLLIGIPLFTAFILSFQFEYRKT